SSIFEMFTQVDRNLERAQGGLGIGLTLVKRLVEMHEGTVEVRSDGPSKGSEFIVRLPLLTEPAESRPGEQTTGGDRSPPTPGHRILVADDNKDGAESLGMLLRLTGNEVRIAHDGEEAVTTASSFSPNVVLLDIGMPKLNGYEAARLIRHDAHERPVT